MRFILYLVTVSCLVPALQAAPRSGECIRNPVECCRPVGRKIVCGGELCDP
ncbi:hypothetical protein PGT21_020824 [Puccinia graminis f. sp. tritici]|uniref:Uncharacterized protein n=1 Tax=Puccinia graminis f. sp. tritici TaxID=56615 RepID=A0A5B0QX26_PUCGR|nr:hypothetical protein PGT21_020824 [Puccinia graminis f. sp. tritici]KAA1138063.1 hypothetical protein PGTUg99_027504 [Puccinia graminis f. sp. tritici]